MPVDGRGGRLDPPSPPCSGKTPGVGGGGAKFASPVRIAAHFWDFGSAEPGLVSSTRSALRALPREDRCAVVLGLRHPLNPPRVPGGWHWWRDPVACRAWSRGPERHGPGLVSAAAPGWWVPARVLSPLHGAAARSGDSRPADMRKLFSGTLASEEVGFAFDRLVLDGLVGGFADTSDRTGKVWRDRRVVLALESSLERSLAHRRPRLYLTARLRCARVTRRSSLEARLAAPSVKLCRA